MEVAEELKDTCWLGERISEGQIRSLKENQSWDVYEHSMAREEVGKYLTKIEFNLGDCGLFPILQPKHLAIVIEAVKLLDKMPYNDYLSFIRTEDGFEWQLIKDQLRPFLIEDGGLSSIQNDENWDIYVSSFPLEQNQNSFSKSYQISIGYIKYCTIIFTLKS